MRLHGRGAGVPRRPRTPEPYATPAPTRRLPAPCARPYVPAPAMGAVRAAETGISPEKSVARSAPMRCIPLYQQTKPITVTTTACQSRAAVSPAVGTRRSEPPSSSRPSRADSTAATPQTAAERSFGPSGRSTGTARTAKPTSPASAPTENSTPARSVRPPALDGERPHGDEARRVQGDAGRTAPVQQRDEHADDDRRTAHEDARNSRLRRPFGRQDRQVEPDHAHRGEQRDPPPLAAGEASEPGRRRVRIAAQERDEQQRGETVAERLAAGVRIVAEDAVGREGCPHQHAGEGREEGPAQRGRVHGADARVGDGPV